MRKPLYPHEAKRRDHCVDCYRAITRREYRPKWLAANRERFNKYKREWAVEERAATRGMYDEA